MSGLGVLLVGLGALIVGLLAGALAAYVAVRQNGSAGTDEPEVGHARSVAELSRVVLDGAPLAVLALDPDEDVLLANRRAHDLGLLDRRGPLDPLRSIARVGRQSGGTTSELQLPTGGLPRRVLQVRVTAIPLPERVVALIVEDLTESHRVDVVRRDFVANVSHEIKTPVGALRLLAEAALEAIGDPDGADSARHFVERISHESARLGRLVSELLDLSRLQGAEALPTPVPVNLDDVVSEAVDRVAPHADAKEISVVRGAPSGAVVPGVEPQLVTAVANLLDNAINYSPDGTRVGVGIRPRDGSWEVTVTDQGLGIPEADLDRIFERFYRVDPARSRATGGTGLGLAIVKHIIRNHGGEVRVWSAPGAGSSFTLCLPGREAFPAPERHAATRSTEFSHAPHQPGSPAFPSEDDVSPAVPLVSLPPVSAPPVSAPPVSPRRRGGR